MLGWISVTSEATPLPLPLTVTLSVDFSTVAVVYVVAEPLVENIGTTMAATAISTTASTTHHIQRRRFFGAPIPLTVPSPVPPSSFPPPVPLRL
jgi:hypothetical protein